MTTVFSVTEIVHHLKTNIERTYSCVKVRGEVGRATQAPSGHWYIDIKDQQAILAIVIWRGTTLQTKPQEGLEVVVTGKMTIFPGQSKYQLVATQMEASGIGAWMVLLEERRKRLLAEGLFEVAHKKPLPFLPRVIGLITSPTGAVILDMLHRFQERFAALHIILWPVRVQGEQAANEVTQAICGFNTPSNWRIFPKPDVLIVARGGGSLEDLWCFNEENVVRATYASAIPIVSAIGHETDTTLIDFASDKRAPTPTAAAEFVTPVLTQLKDTLTHLEKRMTHTIHRLLAQARYYVSRLSLPTLTDLLAATWQRLDFIILALRRTLAHTLERWRYQVTHAGRLLEAFCYHNVLKRGFAIVRHRGAILTHWHEMEKDAKLEVELSGGKGYVVFLRKGV